MWKIVYFFTSHCALLYNVRPMHIFKLIEFYCDSYYSYCVTQSKKLVDIKFKDYAISLWVYKLKNKKLNKEKDGRILCFMLRKQTSGWTSDVGRKPFGFDVCFTFYRVAYEWNQQMHCKFPIFINVTISLHVSGNFSAHHQERYQPYDGFGTILCWNIRSK